MLALDTNLLLRLITNDDAKQALRVQQALDAELDVGRECMVGHIVLCELVWVLTKLFGYSLKQCQQAMAQVVAFPGLRFEAMPVVLGAMQAWQQHGGDLADHCWVRKCSSLAVRLCSLLINVPPKLRHTGC
ncbi:MAG: type II toxin-antitoxin system VapC family toxin [Brachymonas sp.]|nr:type II toxin-antitoxin system VapC family toxin [Brachymonas sp.]